MVDPYPQFNAVQDNVMTNNGTNPTPHPLATYAADVTYVALEHYGNCFAKNGDGVTSSWPLSDPIWLLDGKCL